jgi:hypothetical protein
MMSPALAGTAGAGAAFEVWPPLTRSPVRIRAVALVVLSRTSREPRISAFPIQDAT